MLYFCQKITISFTSCLQMSISKKNQKWLVLLLNAVVVRACPNLLDSSEDGGGNIRLKLYLVDVETCENFAAPADGVFGGEVVERVGHNVCAAMHAAADTAFCHQFVYTQIDHFLKHVTRHDLFVLFQIRSLLHAAENLLTKAAKSIKGHILTTTL